MDEKPWYRLKKDDLLEHKIRDFRLTLSASPVEPYILKLYEELSAKGLRFQPPCFVADEWFTPVDIPAIGIPFYLVHHRLRHIEKEFMLEVEGGTKQEFMKLIRHEAGHAYAYAYRLHRKREWQMRFGSASKDYPEPDQYRPRPYSRLFVQHLDNWYAQAHPDEDFAETFAIWLTPHTNWKKKYRRWKALEKLDYVDRLMRTVMEKPPKHEPAWKISEYDGLNVKLKTYYQRKRRLYADSYPDFYDHDLRVLFTDQNEDASSTRAYAYLKINKEHVIRSVAFWTKEKKYTIDQLMTRLMTRTRELNLYTRREPADLDFKLASFITMLISNYRFMGKFKRTK